MLSCRRFGWDSQVDCSPLENRSRGVRAESCAQRNKSSTSIRHNNAGRVEALAIPMVGKQPTRALGSDAASAPPDHAVGAEIHSSILIKWLLADKLAASTLGKRPSVGLTSHVPSLPFNQRNWKFFVVLRLVPARSARDGCHPTPHGAFGRCLTRGNAKDLHSCDPFHDEDPHRLSGCDLALREGGQRDAHFSRR